MHEWHRPIHSENIWLLTKEEYDELPDDTVLVSINGKYYVKGKDAVYFDTRGEMLSVGLTIGMAEEQHLTDKFIMWMLKS